MKKTLLIVVLAGLYWNYKNKFDATDTQITSSEIVAIENTQPIKVELSNNYKCDGRTHCSQMNSYEEAKFFLENCPNTRMDGDHDGEPCEKQF